MKSLKEKIDIKYDKKLVICPNYGHFEKKLRSVIVSQNHYLNQILDVHPLEKYNQHMTQDNTVITYQRKIQTEHASNEYSQHLPQKNIVITCHTRIQQDCHTVIEKHISQLSQKSI